MRGNKISKRVKVMNNNHYINVIFTFLCNDPKLVSHVILQRGLKLLDRITPEAILKFLNIASQLHLSTKFHVVCSQG